MPDPLISKTSFLAGCQCPKLLWTKLNDRDALPGVDPATQAIFDQGQHNRILTTTEESLGAIDRIECPIP